MLSIEEGKDYDNVDDASLPYTLVRNLGHGHSGNVEEVRDEVTKTVFARKTIYIPASRLSKQERTRVFHNEVKIIRALGRHRHIISVFATYVTKRHFGLILQPVASDGDLEDFLAEYWDIVSELEEPNTHNPRLKAMVPVLEMAFGCLAAGLAFMHDKKVRHKDVKPRNILVHQDLVLYTDFGYSFDWNGFNRSTTEGRPEFLTRKYSAPEVLNHEKRNSRSDLYSLGCVFIDLLVALTLTQDPDNETSCYSESMADIQGRFKNQDIRSRYSFLPEIISGMTDIVSTKRLRAADVAIKIRIVPGFSCKDCTPTPIKTGGSGLFQSGEFEFVGSMETLTLKQKQTTAEDAVKGMPKEPASESSRATPQKHNELEEIILCQQKLEEFKSNQSMKNNFIDREFGAYKNGRNHPGDALKSLNLLDNVNSELNPNPKQRGESIASNKTHQILGYEDHPAMKPMNKETLTVSRPKNLEGSGEEEDVYAEIGSSSHQLGGVDKKLTKASTLASKTGSSLVSNQNTPPGMLFSEATQWEWSDTYNDRYWWRSDGNGDFYYLWVKQWRIDNSGASEQL